MGKGYQERETLNHFVMIVRRNEKKIKFFFFKTSAYLEVWLRKYIFYIFVFA